MAQHVIGNRHPSRLRLHAPGRLGRLTLVVLLVAALGLVGLPRLLSVVLFPTSQATVVVPGTPKPVGTPKTQPVVPRPPAKPAAPPRPDRVTVRWGDTLWAIAQRNGTTVAELQQLNGLGDSTRIMAGSSLLVAGTVPEPAVAPHAMTTHAVTTPAMPVPAMPVAAPHAVPSGPAVARVLAYARAQLGKPYVWGGTGPVGFDCSGLVLRAWQAGGVQLPRTAAAQAHAGVPTSRAALAPGDLVITNGYGHVELYLGDGQVIYAPHTGDVVRVGPLPEFVNAYVHINP